MKNKTQISIRMSTHIVDKLRDMAYFDRRNIQDIVEQAVGSYIGQHERQRDEPYPPRKIKK